jgi:hypothetical protein
MAMIMALDGHPALEWEGMVKNAWWGCLLGKGLLFKLTTTPDAEPIVFVSLGFVGYATLGWRLPYVNGQAYISMADGKGQCLQWFFGHDVHTKCSGLHVEQLVCRPHNIKCFSYAVLSTGACPSQTQFTHCPARSGRR